MCIYTHAYAQTPVDSYDYNLLYLINLVYFTRTTNDTNLFILFY